LHRSGTPALAWSRWPAISPRRRASAVAPRFWTIHASSSVASSPRTSRARTHGRWPGDGRYRLRRQAAEKGVVAARETLALDRLRLREDAREAFADWALRHERSSLLAAHVEVIGGLADYMAVRAERGEESGLAAGRLRLASAQARGDAAVAETDRLQAEAAARAWSAHLPEEVAPVRPPLLDPVPAASTVTPEIKALTADVDRATREHRLAGRFWGFPEFQLGWQKVDQAPNAASGPVFGLSWSVPLFDRGQADRAFAQRRREVAEARLDLATRRASLQQAASSTRYRTLVAAVRRIGQDAASSARLREGAIASFRAGETSVTDLLDTLHSVVEAQVRELEIYAAALEAHRGLELAAGRPLGGQP
jgi:outer membrane protein TolC